MGEARTSSRIASSCYESLMEILRKHQVNLPSLAISVGRSNDKRLQDIPVEPRSEENGLASNIQRRPTATYADSDLEMINSVEGSEDVWQDYLFHGSSLDPQSWQAVLNDLGMHIV